MRFFIRRDLNVRSPHIKVVLFPFIAFVIFFLIGDFLITVSNLGLTPESVAEYYRGNEEKFLEPKGLILILEEVHIRSFLFGFSLLVLSSLLLQANLSQKKKVVLIVVSFASGLIDSLGGILIAYLHPFFSVLKVLAFLSLYSSSSIMILIIMVQLGKYTRSPKTDSPGKTSVSAPELQVQDFPKNPDPKTGAPHSPRKSGSEYSLNDRK